MWEGQGKKKKLGDRVIFFGICQKKFFKADLGPFFGRLFPQ